MGKAFESGKALEVGDYQIANSPIAQSPMYERCLGWRGTAGSERPVEAVCRRDQRGVQALRR